MKLFIPFYKGGIPPINQGVADFADLKTMELNYDFCEDLSSIRKKIFFMIWVLFVNIIMQGSAII